MGMLTEKVAFIKGLCEGLNLDSKEKETKLFMKIIEALDEFAVVIEELDDRQTELEEVVDDIDEDLGALEEEFYDDECDCGCEDDDFVEVECPHCGETVYFDADMLEQPELVCPNCNEYIYEDEAEAPEDSDQ